MKTQEILSIIALSLLGLCFLSGLVKMAMKKESHKKPYEQGCTASVFIAVVLLGISQLLTETASVTSKSDIGDIPRSQAKFEQYYKDNSWGNEESFSGDGSTVEVNKVRVKFLSDFMRQNNIKYMYDIPCGDANWQYTIPAVQSGDVQYYGSDVSQNAINMAKIKNKDRSYMHFLPPVNLIEGVPYIQNPEKSLFLLKEVVQHVPLDEGMKMITNIIRSGVRYLAVTNHAKDIFDVHENKNIDFGGFYPNNMFLPPFNFKQPILDVNNLLSTKEEKKKFGNLLIFDLYNSNWVRNYT